LVYVRICIYNIYLKFGEEHSNKHSYNLGNIVMHTVLQEYIRLIQAIETVSVSGNSLRTNTRKYYAFYVTFYKYDPKFITTNDAIYIYKSLTTYRCNRSIKHAGKV